MRSKHRQVQAALFALENASVREIASTAGCTRQTARRHLNHLFREEMAGCGGERGRDGHPWWVNVWCLTEKGREVLGALNVLEEDVERLCLGVPEPAQACGSQFCGLEPYIMTEDPRLPYDVLPSMRTGSGGSSAL